MELVTATHLRAVIVFLTKADMINLPRKLKKIGKDLRNGYGGKIEEGESAAIAAQRELKEEAGVVVDLEDLHNSGTVIFHNLLKDGTTCKVEGEIFFAHRYQGEPHASDTGEMGPPEWFFKYNVPYHELMPADCIWLPPMLAGHKIWAEVFYGPGQNKLIKPSIIKPKER